MPYEAGEFRMTVGLDSLIGFGIERGDIITVKMLEKDELEDGKLYIVGHPMKRVSEELTEVRMSIIRAHVVEGGYRLEAPNGKSRVVKSIGHIFGRITELQKPARHL